ncbi:uncharacterized protein LOC5509623 [Nematostella vectensis]|uniref:uncharacterized protein LOC5509623 n=1 Tax=Nematostella vectensis TaxID=45351 RepID=UPI0013903309|nr:uncharacterized protein LOC5509623 [Nematostella vectensis]
MLRRVVVENYVIFKGRHELDFMGRDGCNFYTFVGENASGKSSLVALIKAASNLQEEGPDFEVIDNCKESKVVCEFEFKNGAELIRHCDHCNEASATQLVSPGLSSWFSDDILKIPTPFFDQIFEYCRGGTKRIQVLAGHRHQSLPQTTESSRRKENEVDRISNSQFLYILMDDGILVATKSGGHLITGFHEPLPAGVNPADWVPQKSFLINRREVPYASEAITDGEVSTNTSCASLDDLFHSNMPRNASMQSNISMEMTAHDQSDEGVRLRHASIDSCRSSLASVLLKRPAWRRQSSYGGLAWSNYHELKKIIVAELLHDFPDESVTEIHPLFHEIIGDKSITFETPKGEDVFQVMDNKTKRVMRRIPEGLFSAFIIAALLVKPSTRNVILDEPTRGMHPLQTRRLRNILMRESVRRRKCIIATTHSPELLDCDRITLIWRFQLLPDGYCQIRRVTARYSERELLFIGAPEVREIFFSRHIIWVEGESDKRFIEALLGLFDEGRGALFKALQVERAERSFSNEDSNRSLSPDWTPPRSRSPSPTPSHRGNDAYVQKLLQDPAYERKYYTAEELGMIQEAVRSCKVLSVGGKMNLWKGAAICRDLHIPYAIICDLDAIVPNSRENSIQSQFERAEGDWYSASIPHAKAKLVDEEEAPASKAIDETEHAQLAKLRSLRTVGEVIRFYEQNHYIFAWWPMGGEIEDAVRLTKAQFGKKLWPDMLSEEIKSFILSLIDPRKLLIKNPKDKEASKGPNLEILRCIYFIIRFFKETLEKIS